MKILTFQHPNSLDQLHDELLAALPALRPIRDPSGRIFPDGTPALVPVMRVEANGDAITLIVPDDADEMAIRAVVQAHVPAPPSPAADPAAAAQQRAADTALVLQAFAAIVPDPAAQEALARILGVAQLS